jgi:beta propeller repeat protein
MKKRKSWFRRYWVLTTILVIIISYLIIGIVIDSSNIKQTELSEETEENIEVTKQVKIDKGLIEISIDKNIGNPSLSDNYIVFNTLLGSNKDIYLYNLSSKEIRQITHDNSNQYSPKIVDNKILWIDERFETDSLFLYDLSEKEEKRILDSDSFKIYEKGIVWFSKNITLPRPDLGAGHGIITYYYLNKMNIIDFTNESVQYSKNCINSHHCIDYLPNPSSYSLQNGEFFEDYTIWIQDSNQILLFNFISSEVKILTDNNSQKQNLCVFENKIVWSDNRNGLKNYDLYMLNLETGEEIQITNFQDTTEIECSIYDRKVVYSRLKKGDKGYKEIYMYDLTTGENKQISENDWNDSNPQIYKNKVIWQGWNSGSFYAKPMIYLYTF